MPLQKSGPISFSQISKEFRRSSVNIDLEAYRRLAGIVKDIPTNEQVPTTNPIGMKNMYDSRYYYMKVSFTIVGESPAMEVYGGYGHNYGYAYVRRGDGAVNVTVEGVSNNYAVTLVGRSTIFLTANGTARIRNIASDNYTVIVSDVTNRTNYSFKARVGYGYGASNYVKDDTNQSLILGQTYTIG